MKKVFLMLAIGAMMMVACDKVDEYTSPAGAIGEWTEGSGVTNQDQRALVEKYTGAKCVNCPNGDKIIANAHETYGDKMIAIAIDGPGPMGIPYNNEINTHTAEGDAWAEYFGINALPMALINRSKESGTWQLINVDAIPNTVDAIVNQQASIAVAIENHVSSEKSNTTVNLEFLQAIEEPLTLTLLVVEDSIKAKQLTPEGLDKNYMHNHVLRDVVTDLWGMDVDATGAQGERRKVTLSFDINPTWKIKDCQIIAFVSTKDGREIINSASCKL